MLNIITVMNAKGGVGKSALVLALAETLATYHGKRNIVIDADAQASVSHLLARQPQFEAAQSLGVAPLWISSRALCSRNSMRPGRSSCLPTLPM
jgi:cellulose biosynthesis protein BcsQ